MEDLNRSRQSKSKFFRFIISEYSRTNVLGLVGKIKRNKNHHLDTYYCMILARYTFDSVIQTTPR